MKAVFRLLVSLMLLHVQANGQDLMQEMVNAVSADSLMATITALQNFGTRFENSPQRDSAASFLFNEFSRFGLNARSDWYSYGTITLYDIAANGVGALFAVGSSGVILTSSDGGDHWVRVGTNSELPLYGIAFANSQIGCAVGASGTCFRTTDGGSTWNGISTGITAPFYDVALAFDTLGIIVGGDGEVRRTTDAGAHWSPVSSGTTWYLRSVKFLSASNIWISGDRGTLLHSTDAGLSWVPVSSGVTSLLHALDFSSPARGWAVGAGPAIVSTSDGGTHWTKAALPPDASRTLRGICFQDSLQGWIVDYYGKVFRTTDAGAHWNMTYDYASGDWGPYFFTIKLLPGAQLFTCGSQGVLLSSTSGGDSWTSQTSNLPDAVLHTTRNIVATKQGLDKVGMECVLVAHYDSYCQNADPNSTAPGANDNGSGTSAILEAARIASKYDFLNSLKFVAVSAEELGMYGSNHYARQAREQARYILGVVNGDMIGFPTTTDTARLVAATYLTPNRLTDSALVANQRYGIGLTLVVLLDSTGASDYGPFALMGYDALDIAEGTAPEIWGGADPYYHSTLDLASNIRPDLVRRGAQLMLAVAGNLAHPAGRATGVQQQVPHLPERFALEQNYPNPFNPTTRIRYTVGRVVVPSGAFLGGVEGPASSNVRLVIYDLLGREVAVLVDEKKAPGSYEVTFSAKGGSASGGDGGRLASGMYIYRLTVGSFLQTRTMLYLK